MKIYVATGCGAVDWPQTFDPLVVTDRGIAARAWADWVLEGIGYPNDDPDEDDVRTIESMRDSFINDETQVTLLWTVGGDRGPIDEMWTYQVFAVEVPNVQPITLRSGRKL